MGTEKEKNNTLRRLLMLMTAAVLALSFSALAEEPEGYETEEPYTDGETYEGEDEEPDRWYTVYVSEPDGNGGGKPVALEYTAGQDLPGNTEYSWYPCDEYGEKGDLLAVTGEPRFITEGFDGPQVRFYICCPSADGEDYDSELFATGFTGLPVIRIDTENGEKIASRDQYISGTITVTDGETVAELPASVKGRGNATFSYPKKPYTVRLEEKAGLLGMRKAKKWALLAGYCDKTLLRAALGFRTSELLGMEYTPDYRYVELVINGEYRGTYILAETVKAEAKQLAFDTGGYVVEETPYESDDPVFCTEKNQFRFRYPDEDEITPEVMETVSEEIGRMETALLDLGRDDGIPAEIDADSWINWLLVQNILANQDTNRYYYKADSDSKICMGPVWDFEWSVGIGWYYGDRPNPNHRLIACTAYFQKLLKNRAFREKLKERWSGIVPGLEETLTDFMDETIREIDVSRQLNFYRWWILDMRVGAGGIPLGTYEAEVECDKAYLREHIRWLNDEISGMEP